LRALKPNWKIIILFCFIIATIASAISIFHTIIKFQNIPFPWDPGAHACEGLKIAQDLKAGDIISFIGDTYRQSWWPFFHSWLLAPAFILFGNTYAVARGVSLFCFILFILTVYYIGIGMNSQRGHWIGLIPVYLALMSLPFLVLSAMCMSEIPGLLMTFITLLIYLKAIKKQSTFLYVCTSILMALTLFTKWHHGVFVVLAIFITQLTSNKKILSRCNYSLFFPFLLIMIGWFIYPRHIASFYGHSTFQPHYYKFLSLQNWLYYPKSFFQMYHSSLVIAIVMAISFIYSLKRIKDPKIRLFVTHVLSGIILMTIKLDNRHRYIITIVPSIWILGASQLVDTVYYFKSRLNKRKIKVAFASIIVFAISIISFISVPKIYKSYPDLMLGINYWSDEKPKKAYEFIARNVDNHNQIAVFASWDYYNSLNGPTIQWHIEVRRDNDAFGIKNKKERVYHYFCQFLKNRDKESYQNFIQFLENKDVRVNEYHLLSFMKILNMKAYQDYRKKININPFADKIIDIVSIDSRITCLITILNEEDKEFNYHTKQFFLNQDEWTEFLREKFIDLGITIALYERKVVSKDDFK